MLSYHIQYFKFAMASIIWKKHSDQIYTSANWLVPTLPPAEHQGGRRAPSHSNSPAFPNILHLSRDLFIPTYFQSPFIPKAREVCFNKHCRIDLFTKGSRNSFLFGFRITSCL